MEAPERQHSSDPPAPAAPVPAMPPKPRKTSASGAPRRVRSGSGQNAAPGATTAASTGGIVVGGLRRRHRVSSGGNGVTVRQESSGSSDDEDGEAAVTTPRKAAAKAKRAATAVRSPSLKNVASMIRSNVRQSILPEENVENGSDVDAQQSFAGVAKQVVNTQRAAKGFLAMWSSGSTGATYVYKGIHMEKKKLELKRVVAEFKELKRRQFYQELVVYLLFLLLFFSLLGWLPVQDSYQQNEVVGSLTCREEGVCELKQVGDVYEFASTVAAKICNRTDVQAQWLRVGGVRLRQVRVREEQCKVHNAWYAPCYPFYAEGLEWKQPIVGESSQRTYAWHDGLGPLQPRLSNSVFEWYASQSSIQSFGSGGYAVDLCAVDVDELQQDEWLSVATRAFSIDFILVNPVTRVFTVGWHVFTYSPSGHMKHFPHSANLRVVGLEENELALSEPATNATNASGTAGEQLLATASSSVASAWAYVRAFDHRIALWALLLLFLATYCVGEASEMATMGVRTYLQTDMWNVFELTHLVVLASFLAYAVRYYQASQGFVGHLDRGGVDHITSDHTAVQELLRSYQQLSDLASIGSAISLLKVFKFLRMNSTLNLLWRVLGMATRDLMGFLVIFNLIFLGYSALGSYAFGSSLEEFSTLGRSYATCFLMLGGEMDYPRLRQANPRIAPVFIVTFIVLVFQILVNMFVAILSEYYEEAKNSANSEEDDDVEYDVLARVRSYLRACSPTVVVDKGEVLRLSPRQSVRLISTNLVDQEETRQRAKKLFRGAVWRVVALLRFGMKFDRRIQFGDRKHNGIQTAVNNKASHIRLSENFDHKTIKEMIPTGITIRLQGDSLLGDGLALKVVRHNKLSVECVVLGQIDSAGHISTTVTDSGLASDSEGEELQHQQRERVLELLGGEKLRIPWQIFARHVAKTALKELRETVLRATKLWHYGKPQLVNDYHLLLLFESVRADGRASLRFDEVYRMLDLFLRRDRRKSHCTQAEVRSEALQVMFRFRKCLIDMPSREKEGHNYRPKPVDTSSIELGQLDHLADMLAHNCHDMWALERLKQGWHYGPFRDDAKKLHPNLVPYHLLSWQEQQYDHRSSMETLKTIVFMNYSVARATGGGSGGSFQDHSRSSSTVSDDLEFVDEMAAPPPLSLAESTTTATPTAEGKTPTKKAVPQLLREAMSFRRSSLMVDSPYSTLYGDKGDLVYHPLPIDTSKVELPPRLLRLVDLLAENAHEVWAKGRMDEGWTFGPQRNDLNKKHPCLVPYIFLTDEEKEYDLNIAKETLKTLLAMKFTLVDRSSRFS